MRNLVVVFMLIVIPGFSQSSGDSLWARNTISLNVGGKALGFLGITYERKLKKKYPEKHPRAFTSVEAGISNPFFDDRLFPGIGLNRNWFLGHRNRWVFNTGIYSGLVIAFTPTPKATRQLYKETNFYGGNFVSPVEFWALGEVGIRCLLKPCIFKISFTPVCYYNSLMNRFYGAPWVGVAVGFNF